jgi:hypothetical protein
MTKKFVERLACFTTASASGAEGVERGGYLF